MPDVTRDLQPTAEKPADAPEPSLAARRAELTVELSTARGALVQVEPGSSEAAALSEDVAALERIGFLLDRQELLADRRDDLEEDRSSVLERTRLWEDGTAAEVIGFLELEALREQAWTLGRREPVKAEAVSAATRGAERAREVLRDAERNQRLAEERANDDADPAERVARSRARHRAELAVREAREALRVAELELELVSLDLGMLRAETALLDDQIAAYAQSAPFSRDDLDSKLADIKARQGELTRQRGMLEADLAQLVELSTAARRRAGQEGPGAELAALEDETLRLERRLRRQELDVRERELKRLADLDQVWRRRYQFATGKPEPEVCREWSSSAEELLSGLDEQTRLDRADLAELRTRRQEVSATLADADPGDLEQTSALRVRIDALEELIDVYEADLDRMARSRLVVERFLGTLRDETATFSPTEAFDWVGDSLSRIWQYEIHSVDDKSIRVRTVVTGILLLALGVWVSRLLSSYLFHSLLRRMGMNEGAAAAIRSLAFYLLALSFGLFALRVVEVPLTVFTLLGGALAIGVGFGSQNLVNNFLSGLILLIERPVRVGDLVEVGGLYGNVLNIGARSTSVRTGDNVDIIVPNSSFLENNVVNWTLGDDTVRVHVEVGVAYGSPVREVQKLLIKATEEHGKVQRHPAPFVLFRSFGDNALIFELHFWTRIRRLMDRKRIESDMRFRVERLFRDGGIVIAFPQRDVHLDAAGPVRVQVVPPPPADAYEEPYG